MGMEIQYPTDPLPLSEAARCLSVPARWLREEIESGRLPGLVAGSAILIHVPTVAAVLTERVKAGNNGASAKGGAA